jgi:hypothetical protein
LNVESVLVVLKALFLVLLYLFVWRVIRSAARDLRVPQESFVLAPSQAAALGLGARAPSAEPARLVVVSSEVLELGTSVGVGPVPLTVGRSEENSLVLEGDGFASARHARVEAGRDGIWLVDLGSTNGTQVNGERIEGRRRLREGDLIRIGDTELRLET